MLLKFQIKNMGSLFYLPLLFCAFYIIFLLLIPAELEGILFLILQIAVLPFSFWWPVFNIYDLYQNNVEEIFATYIGKNLLFDYLRFTSLFLILILFLFFITNIKVGQPFPLHLVFLLIGQTFIISSFVLLITIYLKSIEIASMSAILYVFSEAVTTGEIFPWPHIFIFSLDSHNLNVLWIQMIIYLFISAIFLFASIKYAKTIERNII